MNRAALIAHCEGQVRPNGLGLVVLVLPAHKRKDYRLLRGAGSPLGRVIGQTDDADVVQFDAAVVLTWLCSQEPPPLVLPLGPHPCYKCGASTTRQTRLNDAGEIDLMAPFRPVCYACGPVYPVVGVLADEDDLTRDRGT